MARSVPAGARRRELHCRGLSDIGLQMKRDGTLSIDNTKFDAATGNRTELKKAFANSDAQNSLNDGFARRCANLATQVLGTDGSLTTRTEGLRERIARNGEAQLRVEDRVQRFQARLVARYTAMDANVSRLNSLSSQITQQLNALNNNDSNSR